MKIGIEIYFDDQKGEFIFEVSAEKAWAKRPNLNDALNDAEVPEEHWDTIFEEVNKRCNSNTEITIKL